MPGYSEYLVFAFAAQFYVERRSSFVPEDDYKRYLLADCRSDHEKVLIWSLIYHYYENVCNLISSGD